MKTCYKKKANRFHKSNVVTNQKKINIIFLPLRGYFNSVSLTKEEYRDMRSEG